MIRGKKILLTGGAGFIGSHLAERLCMDNEVTVFDSLRRDAMKFLPEEVRGRVEFVQGDILEEGAVGKALEGKDVAVHLAAIAGVSSVIKQPTLVMKINLLAALRLYEACKDLGLERFVGFSTSEVYGAHASNVSEDSSTVQGPAGEPRWTYAVSKLAAEHAGLAYYQEHGLPFVSIRPFNVYGPRQVGTGAIRNFVAQAVKGLPLAINGSGEQTRAWCYISDLVDGVLAAVEKTGAVGQIFNIGNPSASATTKRLAEKIVELAASKSKIVHKEIDYAEVEERSPNITKATKILGYEPKVSLNEGIASTINWFRQYGSSI